MEFPTIYDELFEARDDKERFAISQRMTDEERFLAGFQLFKREMERRKTTLRKQFPWMDDADIERAIERQLEMSREVKDHIP